LSIETRGFDVNRLAGSFSLGLREILPSKLRKVNAALPLFLTISYYGIQDLSPARSFLSASPANRNCNIRVSEKREGL
jgi:hypothetical protein